MLDSTLFVSTEIHARQVLMADGTEAVFHFREATARQIRKWREWMNHDDPAERETATAYLVSECLCDESGSPALTLEDAGRLKVFIAERFRDVVLSLAGFDAKNA